MNVLFCPSYTSFYEQLLISVFLAFLLGQQPLLVKAHLLRSSVCLLNKQMPSETPFGKLKNSFSKVFRGVGRGLVA